MVTLQEAGKSPGLRGAVAGYLASTTKGMWPKMGPGGVVDRRQALVVNPRHRPSTLDRSRRPDQGSRHKPGRRRQNDGMAMDLRIGILGPLDVRVGFGEPVQVVGPRLRALLIRLAIEPDRVVLAGALMDAVWDSDPPLAATGALQSLVSRLRRLLPDVVESQATGYRLAVDPEVVDSVRFERLALAGREALRRDPRRALDLLREALALWRGPALADVATARFAGAAVARLEELRLGAVEDRIEAELASGAGDRLVAELDELVTAHPLRERLSGLLVRALARAGRQADALGAYERLRSRLAGELGIDPSEELRAIHLRVLRGEAGAVPAEPEPPPAPAASPPLAPSLPESPSEAAVQAPPSRDRAAGSPRQPEALRTNLRAQITSFVGRDDDIARITEVLGGSRLVTLTGPGGSGKTRLATEAAATMLDRMPEGVWLVELAPVVDPVDLTQAVLSVLGARELGLLTRQGRGPSPVPPQERIVQAIGDKRLLLVMDNCEHLVGPAAALIDSLLAGCPELRVLATSREPLGITGEMLHPVGPLPMPVEDGMAAEALRFPAVRLFADRAAAARPGFTVDEATIGPVLHICRALDGIPLAIELAAARLRALSPDQIAARLDDRFRLLAAGSRAALPRHQTLRAVVDWSWELLAEPERVLARRLAVFPGGATLEAAERVCAGPELGGLARDEVLYLLAALVEKSLVVAGDDGAGEVRYSMLETMRAYGEERRREANEDDDLRRAHAGYFLELAELAEPRLRGPEQLQWIRRLTSERENLHGALRWAIDTLHTELAMRLVGALGWYWFLQSARSEGAEWATKVLDLPGPLPAAVRAQAQATTAISVLSSGQDIGRSLEHLDRAIAALEEVPPDDPRRLHPSAALLPVITAILRNNDEVAMRRVHALRDHPDPWVRALEPVVAGQLLINRGEARQAEAQFEVGLERFRALGDRWGVGQTLFARLELSGFGADHEAVIAALLEAKEILEELGDREDVGHIMVRLAHTRAVAGDMDGARRDLEEAERIAQAIGAREERLYNVWTLAQIERWEGNLDGARRVLETGIQEARVESHPFGQIHSSMLASLGHLELAAGDGRAARGCFERALAVALRSRDRPVIARAVELLAAIAMADGEAERAAVLLGEATTLRGLPNEADPDTARVRAAARAVLGEQGFARSYERGTARPRDEVEAALAAGITTSAAETPAAQAARTPPR
jgi:predicted ATPase/DNA-binding SARP family transcriptional activator